MINYTKKDPYDFAKLVKTESFEGIVKINFINNGFTFANHTS